MTILVQPSLYERGVACEFGSQKSSQAKTMSADVSYLYSISPPFSYQTSYYSIQNRMRSYVPNHTLKMAPTTTQMAHEKVPQTSPKVLKPCLKLLQKVNAICAKTKPEFITLDGDATKTSMPKEKRVTFADTQGYSLTLIKYLTESTNEPPRCLTSGELIRNMVKSLNLSTPGSDRPAVEKEPNFSLKFSQPVSDYIAFKSKVEKQFVCLENALIKQGQALVGTVKVKNISYEKHVNVRVSYDNWKSFTDYPCFYVKNAYESGTVDTFQFQIDFLKTASQSPGSIEFCIQFKSDNGEFWDNNNDENYVVMSSTHIFSKAGTQPRAIPSNPQVIPQFQPTPSPELRSWSTWHMQSPFY